MKYIRANDNKIYNTSKLIKCEDKRFSDGWFTKSGVPLIAIKQADTIEELCDAFVIFYNKSKHKVSVLKSMPTARLYCKRDKRYSGNYVDKVYGAIWTDKGLIYVAKMNEKGELELL